MKKINFNNIKKILLIRPDMIGDTVLITPALSLLRKKFPNAHISLLLRNYTRELFENHPDLNEIIIDKISEGKVKKPLDFLRYAKEIREKKFDLAIAFYNEFPYAFLIWLAGVPLRIGDRSKILFGWMYNVKIYQRWSDLTKHEVEHNIELLKPLGIYLNSDSPPPLKIPTPKQKFELPQSNLIVTINPGIGRTSKAWLPDRYAKVAKWLIDHYQARVIITGTDKDKPAAFEILKETRNKALDLTGKTNLSQLVSIISQSKLFISSDTGPLHIAAALKISTLALFPTKSLKPTEWGPWMTPHVIVRNPQKCKRRCFPKSCKYDDCLQAISTEEVLAAAKTLLQEEKKQTLKEAKLNWLKKSLNILTNDQNIFRELKQDEYNVILVENWLTFVGFTRKIIEHDINLIHWIGRKNLINLLFAKMISALFVAIPPLFIYEITKKPRTINELIEFYVRKFQTRRYL